MGNNLIEIASGEETQNFLDDKFFYRLLNLKDANYFLELFSKLAPHIKDKIVNAQQVTEDIGVHINDEQRLIAHAKVKFISYPHEWCALMLKDAALFHLKLQLELLSEDLYLKDAHPWNILYEKGTFKFVDLASIVEESQFHKLDYISPAATGKDTVLNGFNQMMQMMFMPYFILPLLGYAYGKRSWIKSRIEVTTLNAATSVISKRDCFPTRKLTFSNIKRYFLIHQKLKQATELLSQKSVKVRNILQDLYALIEDIDVQVGNSDYRNYYSNKGEQNSYEYSSDWNNKQKNVYHALNDINIKSVVDIACNTGWYSIMAEKMGKQVVALDYDEGCIEELYMQVREHQYNILPIWCSFLELTPDRFSIAKGKRVLINFAERMQCDAVVALGIIHHLVLGLGLTLDVVMERLSRFSLKKLIIEFISIDDEMLVKHVDFFPSYSSDKTMFNNYNIHSLIECGKNYFNKYEVKSSHPGTRSIVIFEN